MKNKDLMKVVESINENTSGAFMDFKKYILHYFENLRTKRKRIMLR